MINTIIEGCFPDTPEFLMYHDLELEIPTNAEIVLSDHKLNPYRYSPENPDDFTVINDPFFRRDVANPSKKIKGGWPILEHEPNFRCIFDAQRSLTTRDGRVYVSATYFEENWRWYLEVISKIIEECGQVFRGEKTAGWFQNHSTRIF